MATNREKYIDNASNEEIAQAITNFVMSVVYGKNRDKNKSITEYIAQWLSQEVEEDAEEDAVEVASPEISRAIKSVDERIAKLEQKINDNSDRLDKLEEEGKTKDQKDFADMYNIQPSGYGYVSVPVEKTADEMFKELGYIKEGKFSGCIAYWCDEYKRRITIDWNDEYEKATNFEYQKSRGANSVSDTITEEEDKAIRKKIEELKNE